MTASILDHLDGLADQHPDKLLYSYLDVNGDPIESYTYASFLHRTQAIAGHLLKEGRFAAGDRLLLAFQAGDVGGAGTKRRQAPTAVAAMEVQHLRAFE